MNPLMPDAWIRDVVLEAFSMAISFYKDSAANASDARQIARANVKIMEYTSGISMVDLLVDPDGEAFLMPESVDIMVNSLMNFIKDIDRAKNPLLAHHISNVAILCRNAGFHTSDDDDVPLSPNIH
ncbi:hypothetical protein ACRAWG_35695 [Methylobacterium sp. P31]